MKFKGINLKNIAFILLTSTLTMASAQDKTGENNISEKQIERFATTITQIHHYYLKPTSYSKLFDSAIRGMLTGLDPHSDYLSPGDIKELQTSTTGEYAGIGIEILPENGLIKVISPLADTPADKAGMQAGDVIIKINDRIIKDLSTDEAIKLIKGPAGTTVNLTVFREGAEKPIEIPITREFIQIKSVTSKLYRNKIVYTKVAIFNDTTAVEVAKQIQELDASNGKVKGLVLDLRNNPGGTLSSAIETSDLFIDNKNNDYDNTIVYTKGRLDVDNITAYANPGDMLDNKPIIVLVNNGSASASEIVAGALKDHKRAIVMGTKSFGKGSVQTVIPIDYESAIKLTTALYYTPNGTSIQANGIVPDVYAPYTKIPQEKEQGVLDDITESSLIGHIRAPQNNDKNDDIMAKKEQQAELAYSDFQLYQALNLLEGMIVRNS